MAEGKHRPLTPMAARFVEHYCAGKSKKEAAIAAGALPKQASIVAYRYLQTVPVREAIDAYNAKMQQTLEAKAVYNAEAASEEIDRAIQFAMRTNNATAYTRCIELRMKLRGLLEKEKDTGGANFQINIVGLKAPGAKVVNPEGQEPEVDIFG